MTVWSIIVAAGTGSRFGGSQPKQYEQLAGRRVVDWALDAARHLSDGVVLVVPPDRVDDPEPAADRVVAGATTRSGSVRAGLAAVPEDCDIVMIHDAARPLASLGLFESVVGTVLAGADGAIPGVPVIDTIKRLDGDEVVETIERDDLVAVQTPQAFRADVLRRAHEGDPEATDDATLVEEVGGIVLVVDGEVTNLKITGPLDLAIATLHLG
ncbi:MAG TPA: 2-C-methyl-D-erythritol 4-phosphate cytidylyltransferase [Acidimicrobiales bacterium]